jgi:hypothetical protein
LDAFTSAEFDDSFGFDGTIDSIDRPIGELAEDIFESSDSDRVARLAIDIRKQYLDLCERVNNANPYFWEGLATEELPCAPGLHGSGSLDEARLVLHHCRRAWDESEDALVMVEADTGRYVRPYEGPKTMENAAPLEKPDISLGSIQAPSMNNELQPYVLAICLAGESLFRDLCGDFIKEMPAHALLTPVYNPESALEFLNGSLPPARMLIADAAIARHREVWERTIDHMRNGATVVVAGCFSSMATTGEFRRVFTIAGLPWRRGSYYRADTRLQPHIIDEHLTSCLPSSLYGKFTFVRDLKQSEAWYVDKDTPDQAGVAFTKFGSGRLGYIGSVNVDLSSVRIACAMFGLNQLLTSF